MTLEPTTIRAEIDEDPAGRGYANYLDSDNVIEQLINEKIYSGRKLVPASQVEFLAWVRNLKPRIAQHAGVIPHLPPTEGTSPIVVLACYMVTDIFNKPAQLLDLDLTQVKSALDILQTAALLDTLNPANGEILIPGEQNRAEIDALANTLVSRAEIIAENIGTYIDSTQISEALGRG
jgi:hypothetical protein